MLKFVSIATAALLVSASALSAAHVLNGVWKTIANDENGEVTQYFRVELNENAPATGVVVPWIEDASGEKTELPQDRVSVRKVDDKTFEIINLSLAQRTTIVLDDNDTISFKLTDAVESKVAFKRVK